MFKTVLATMKTKTISCKRIHNLGNFNSIHFEAIADLEPGENRIKAGKELIAEVETILGLDKPEAIDTQKSQPTPKSQPVVTANTTNTNFDENPF